jgi:hypothetical protein
LHDYTTSGEKTRLGRYFYRSYITRSSSSSSDIGSSNSSVLNIRNNNNDNNNIIIIDIISTSKNSIFNGSIASTIPNATITHDHHHHKSALLSLSNCKQFWLNLTKQLNHHYHHRYNHRSCNINNDRNGEDRNEIDGENNRASIKSGSSGSRNNHIDHDKSIHKNIIDYQEMLKYLHFEKYLYCLLHPYYGGGGDDVIINTDLYQKNSHIPSPICTQQRQRYQQQHHQQHNNNNKYISYLSILNNYHFYNIFLQKILIPYRYIPVRVFIHMLSFITFPHVHMKSFNAFPHVRILSFYTM